MYGWTDPNDPDGTPRRPEQPRDERPPAWPTDRPEPRSAYLFGDAPEQPAEEWHRDRPTAHRQPEPTGTWQAQAAEPTGTWRTGAEDRRQAAPDDRWDAAAGNRWDAHADEPYPAERYPGHDRSAGAWPAGDPTAPIDLTGLRAAPTEATTATDDGRHRSRRRFARPALIGGAAAVATLVVSLGVGAVALTGEDSPAGPTAADPVAAAPVLPGTEQIPGDGLTPPSASTSASATPSTAPSTAAPTPSATKTTKPAPSRTSAPSRQNSERSTTPAGGGAKATVSSGASSQAREVLKLVNAERAKAGCGALAIDTKLTTAAQRHSQDQADHRKMSHTGSDGSDPGTRLDRVGYSWRTYGENVAWNQQTPAAVMKAWMNSSGHRANILNCAFTEIGVGVASSNGPYWTQVFAAPR